VAALAPSANIIAIKGLSATGTASNTSIADAITEASNLKADIILLPLGSSSEAQEITKAIEGVLKSGALVVAAAGNNAGEEPTFPARQAGVLAVGALDASGKVAPFSSGGLNILWAPGVDILTLEDRGLVKRSGTSFSATVASAIAAVVWGAMPKARAKDVVEILTKTATDLGAATNRPALGNIKRIDLNNALHAVTPRPDTGKS
jgi:subtilisin family serine protease